MSASSWSSIVPARRWSTIRRGKSSTVSYPAGYLQHHQGGSLIAGLTGGYGGDRRVEFILPHSARKAGTAHYYVEASCNGMFGINDMDPPDPNRYYKLNSADLVVPNMEAYGVLWDFDTLHQLVNDLPGDSSLAKRALYAANEMMNVFEEGNAESLPRCRAVAERVLGAGWREAIEKDSHKASKQEGSLWAIGHWFVALTRR